ncbi:MAG: nitrous oxide-stimulated promoter family protein [Prevotella sp.]|uniref:nitrous oxide-stimulated promoter family protein n=1 Tax=Prevotella sp. TaxID=59823 RepID=UPI002A262942|nr:nitrous oxide-stimulated promoter family protein [Prevotella sp.]MDD7317298.1 nitrous oxide-stimulated promoter family protein [Prevotellaceae bacterium]MDY4019902.1 nitrous oxide-stimulated promoter family protein [Prevotella sp.]
MQKNKIEREKKTVRMMIEHYSRRKLKQENVPEEYLRLAEYACRRLDRCRFGEQKTSCKTCPVHCYAPHERDMIRQIMRWAGPRMLLFAPIAAIRHMLGR